LISTQDSVVDSNLLIGFNMRSGTYSAGMFGVNADRVTFQFNNTSGGHTTLDGMAYDVDHSSDSLVFQYNISHDNQGGFFLLCPGGALLANGQPDPNHALKGAKNLIIRYNISMNDRYKTFLTCVAGNGKGQLVNGQIYNNTIGMGAGISTTLVDGLTTGSAQLDVHFRNNLVRKEGSGTVNWSLSDTSFVIDHNAFYNIATPPAWATNTVTASPALSVPEVRDPKGSELLKASPALAPAGVLITNNGGQDFFGNSVSPTAAPNIGAWSAAGTCVPTKTDRFDTDTLGAWPTGWTGSGNVTAQADPAGDFGRSARLTQGTTTATAKASFTGVTVDARVSLRVWASQANAQMEFNLQDTAGNVLAQSALRNTGAVGFHNGTSWVSGPTYSTGEWHLLEMFFHKSTGTWDLSFDGASVASGVSLSGAGNLGAVNVIVPGNATPSAVFNMDELIVERLDVLTCP
jgi:hypothetical protein